MLYSEGLLPREEIIADSREFGKVGFISGFFSGVLYSPLSRLKVLCFGERELLERGFLKDYYKGNTQIIHDMCANDGMIRGPWRGCIMNGVRYGLLGALWAHDRHFHYYHTVYPEGDTYEPFYLGTMIGIEYFLIGTPIEYIRTRFMLDRRDPVTKKFAYGSIRSVWKHRYSRNCEPIALYFAHFKPMTVNLLYNMYYRCFYFGLFDYHIVHTYERNQGKPKKQDVLLTAWVTTTISQLIMLPAEFYRFVTLTTETTYSAKFKPLYWLPVLREIIQNEHAEGKKVVQRYLRQLPLTSIPGTMLLYSYVVLSPLSMAYLEDLRSFIRYWKESDPEQLANDFEEKYAYTPAFHMTGKFMKTICSYIPGIPEPRSILKYRVERDVEERENFEEFKETEKEKLIRHFKTKYPQLDEESIKELIANADIDNIDVGNAKVDEELTPISVIYNFEKEKTGDENLKNP